jgi:hypothetical protein
MKSPVFSSVVDDRSHFGEVKISIVTYNFLVNVNVHDFAEKQIVGTEMDLIFNHTFDSARATIVFSKLYVYVCLMF